MAEKKAYHCSHCGRDFQAEERDIIECPGCFWSSSVSPADTAVRPAPSAVRAGRDREAPSAQPAREKKPVTPFQVVMMLAVVLLVAALWYWKPGRGSARHHVRVLPAETPSATGAAGGNGPETAKTADAHAMEILNTVAPWPTEAGPGPEEMKILKAAAPFKTGLITQLPSQTWSLEQFEKLLAEKQEMYQVPLPRSYRRKLGELFEQTYLPATEAFREGDLLKARDLWISSLAFPVFANDIQKHRGVVLTMLRDYINDILSKIGAINGTLVETRVRSAEQDISRDYMEMKRMIDTGKFLEAAAMTAALRERIEKLERLEGFREGSPPYPPATARLDTGIQAALADIQNAPPPTVADFEPIKEDLRLKSLVLAGLDPGKRSEMKQLYDDALRDIQQKAYAEARKKLLRIDSPVFLAADAREKVRILNTLVDSQLDSAVDSG